LAALPCLAKAPADDAVTPGVVVGTVAPTGGFAAGCWAGWLAVWRAAFDCAAVWDLGEVPIRVSATTVTTVSTGSA
jgi:hypothetical protein